MSPLVRGAPLTRAILVSAILLSPGCSPDAAKTVGPSGTPTIAGAGSSESSSSVTAELTLDQLARSLAMAMSEPQARAAVIRGMQQSPHGEHKLEMDSFLQGEGDQVRESARAHGATDALLSQLESLFPDGLDFYVPSRSQRKVWAGNASLLVVGVADLDAQSARAYDTAGDEHQITGVEVPGYDAVIVVHPAEPKVERVTAAGLQEGTIEDAGSESSAFDPGATMDATCHPDDPCNGGGGGGGPPPPTPTTRVTSVFPDFDDGPFGGNVELYFVTVDVNNTSNAFTSAIVQVQPYVNTGWLNLKIFNGAASPSVELRANLWESDGFTSGDDWKGEPWPTNITGSRDVASFDPFNQIFWAEYRVLAQ